MFFYFLELFGRAEEGLETVPEAGGARRGSAALLMRRAGYVPSAAASSKSIGRNRCIK